MAIYFGREKLENGKSTYLKHHATKLKVGQAWMVWTRRGRSKEIIIFPYPSLLHLSLDRSYPLQPFLYSPQPSAIFFITSIRKMYRESKIPLKISRRLNWESKLYKVKRHFARYPVGLYQFLALSLFLFTFENSLLMN